jgi:hypothetical protein
MGGWICGWSMVGWVGARESEHPNSDISVHLNGPLKTKKLIYVERRRLFLLCSSILLRSYHYIILQRWHY